MTTIVKVKIDTLCDGHVVLISESIARDNQTVLDDDKPEAEFTVHNTNSLTIRELPIIDETKEWDVITDVINEKISALRAEGNNTAADELQRCYSNCGIM